MLYEPVKRLTNVQQHDPAGMAGAQRVFGIIDLVPEIRNRPDAGPPPGSPGRSKLIGTSPSATRTSRRPAEHPSHDPGRRGGRLRGNERRGANDAREPDPPLL